MKTISPPIYGLLRARGHSPAKAAEILIDIKRKDTHARQWLKALRENRESRGLPVESWLTEASYNERACVLISRGCTRDAAWSL